MQHRVHQRFVHVHGAVRVTARVDTQADKERAEFTIWLCPACNRYDADPILRRTEPMRCFGCGYRAEKALDLRRVNPNFHAVRRQEARDSAPLMEPVRVVRANLLADAEKALREIAQTARWYADNDARLAHEVDHALCVEILSTAEDAVAAFDAAGGAETP